MIKKRLGFLALLLLALGIVGTCSEPAISQAISAPRVRTKAASNVGPLSATLNGDLRDTGGETCEVWFKYGRSDTYGYYTPKRSKSSTGLFSEGISGLQSGTYHFKACASNSNGTACGSDWTFKTGGQLFVEPYTEEYYTGSGEFAVQSVAEAYEAVRAASSWKSFTISPRPLNFYYNVPVHIPDVIEVDSISVLRVYYDFMQKWNDSSYGQSGDYELTHLSICIDGSDPIGVGKIDALISSDIGISGIVVAAADSTCFKLKEVPNTGVIQLNILSFSPPLPTDFPPYPGGEGWSATQAFWVFLKFRRIGANGVPVASFTYSPENPAVGEEITFDASSSYDPDGEILEYKWYFGDGNMAEGVQATHAYNRPGNYTVTLMVTDNDGLQDSVLKVITVIKRPVLLVHGINADSSTWNTMIPFLEVEGYAQNENLFTIDLKGHDIKGYGQQVCNKLKEIKSNTGATKVDIVAHSMGGLVSRWCIQKLGGDQDVAKLIMLGAPNHGSLGFAPWMQSDVWWVPPQGASWDLLQMLPDSDFLAGLNYNEKCFEGSSWLIKDDEISSGYTILAGSGFETAEMFWNTYPGNEAFIPKSTYKGDGVVGVRSAKLTSVPCYQYNVNHAELNDGSDVIQDVIHLLNNEPVEHGGACQPSPRDSNEPSLWQRIRIKTNELILKGTIKMFEVILDTMPMAEIGIGYPGSELNLTLRTPSGIVIDPPYASSDPNIDFTYDVNSTDNLGNNYDEKYYTISNPETGSWTIEVNAVNVPPEGEKFSVGVMLKSDLTLLARTRDNIYSFPSGEYVILEAFLWDGDLLNYPGTEVKGTIEKPDGTKEIIAFRDDGTNGDSIAGDGVFTYNYTNTMANGMYYADITANTDSFARQTQLIFSIDMLLDGVNFADYAIFADRWMDQSCTHASWCNGADLNNSAEVDIYDLGILAEYWLAGVGP